MAKKLQRFLYLKDAPIKDNAHRHASFKLIYRISAINGGSRYCRWWRFQASYCIAYATTGRKSRGKKRTKENEGWSG
jgi:hypothetical protein